MKHAVIRRACSVAAVRMFFALTPAVWAIDAGILGRAWQNHPAVSVRYTLENRDVYEYDNRGSGEADLEGRFLAVSVPVGHGIALEGEVGQESWDPHSKHGLDYDAGTAWGVGATALLPLTARQPGQSVFQRIFLGWAVRYRRAEPDSDFRRDVRQKFDPEVEEWQVSCGLVSRYRAGSVGLGLRYSQVDLAYSHPERDRKREGGFEEDEPWGLFLEGELRAGQAFVCGEFRFLDVSGGTVALGWRF
ncbi:MAG: hypothetical protein DRP22_04055 [Verrucomicrobia bacterium]|nr:MAG: hypothetical protein DRP22_04055 [Verrucomicrobiota bacterium]